MPSATCPPPQAVKVSSLGKWKTALQMVSMSLLLLARDQSAVPALWRGAPPGAARGVGAWAFASSAPCVPASLPTASPPPPRALPRPQAPAHTLAPFTPTLRPLPAALRVTGEHAVCGSFAMLWAATGLAAWSLAAYFANVWSHFVSPAGTKTA